MPGASTPITVAGTIALVLAEELTGVAIAQLRKPGAPVIIGGAASPLDMKTALAAYGTPESLLIDLGLCEVCKFLGMPVFSEAGYSDSKLLDEQAAVEAALSIFGMTFSEADLIHDVGYLESGIVSSPEMVVIANEIIAYAKRVKQGIDMDRKHLALDAIDEVGPGGNFLTNMHTLKFYKQAYMPDLFDKSGYEHWAAAGAKSLRERANKRVKEILETHRPVLLPEDKQNEIAGIIKKKRESLPN
jgi:trimethylamine--corrinoid protein Co-methyltransferase